VRTKQKRNSDQEYVRRADRSAGGSQRPGVMKAAEKGSGPRIRRAHQDILGGPVLGDRSCVHEVRILFPPAGSQKRTVRHLGISVIASAPAASLVRKGRGDAVGLPTSFANEREQIVYEMAICLSNSRWVSKGLYDRAVKVLGHVGEHDVREGRADIDASLPALQGEDVRFVPDSPVEEARFELTVPAEDLTQGMVPSSPTERLRTPTERCDATLSMIYIEAGKWAVGGGPLDGWHWCQATRASFKVMQLL
jgi:hypothetical protein